MSQPDAHPKKYNEVATELLQEMWASRDWKDATATMLRDELMARGVSARQLDEITARRKKRKRIVDTLPDPLITIGAFGRVVAILISLPVFLLLQQFAGERAAYAGVVAVTAVYFTVLLWRVRKELRLPHPSSTHFWLTWQCVEAAIVMFILSMPVLFTPV